MTKSKLKKILASGAMGIMALAMPFALTGCDKDSDINVRVDGEYVQWQVEGEDSWTNLISVDEIKDLLGESYKGDTGAKGEQGNPGINGREVEFQSTDTHIQWRYVTTDNSDTWKDLIALSEIEGDDAIIPMARVTYDYNNSILFGEQCFAIDTLPEFSSIVLGSWLDNELVDFSDYGLDEYFEGWFIKDTNYEVNRYTCIGGDIELVAKWNDQKINENFDDKDFVSIGVNFEFDADINGWSALIDENAIEVVVPKYHFDNEYGLNPVLKIDKKDGMIRESLCQTIQLPQGLKYIGSSAFVRCESLISLELPNSIVEIGDSAFKNCSSLTEVIIPDNVEKIGDEIFGYCDNITSIVMPYIRGHKEDGNVFGRFFARGFISTSSELYNNVSQYEVTYNNGVPTTHAMNFVVPKSLKNITITSGEIPIRAFENFVSIECFHIKENASIETATGVQYAFDECENLKTIIIDNELISNNLVDWYSCGMLIWYAETVYIKEGISTNNSECLLNNFAKQTTSDKLGYDMYKINPND